MMKRPTATIVAGAVVFAAMPCASAPSPKVLSAVRRTAPARAAVAPLGPLALESEQGLPETEVTKDLARARDRLARAAARLRNLGDDIAADGRQGRAAVEAKTRIAQDELSAAAPVSVEQDPRGTVIIVPSRGLFASGEPHLLHPAEARLGPIAEALSQDGHHRILVEDHTSGSAVEGSNPKLSQARAEVVRDFFAAHGVRTDLLTPIGAQPTGAGASEARAHEQHIEIIVEPTRRH
jgi:outer membrane protein OmpA-like peptidoglycan-associated protein